MAPRYNGGPILTNVEAVAVFAGANSGTDQYNWHSPGDGSILPEVCLLDRFLFDITDSPYVDKLASEYSERDGAPPIFRGSFLGSYFTMIPGIAPIIDDANIRVMLDTAVTGLHIPVPDKNTVYFVFTQIDVRWRGKVSNRDFGGYHDRFPASSGRDILYAVVPFPTSSPFTADTYTEYVSHELVEAITDPVPGTGWVDASTGDEIADSCELSDGPFQGYRVSGFWWPSEGRCGVPTDSGSPHPGPLLRIIAKSGTTCFGDAIEGETFVLTAQATKRGNPDQLTAYVWTATGALSGFKETFSVPAPSPPAPVTIELDATDELGCQLHATLTIETVSAHEAKLQASICAFIAEIRQTAIINFLPDPLWDPLRDFRIKPVTETELSKLRWFGSQLIEVAELAERVLARHPRRPHGQPVVARGWQPSRRSGSR